MFCFTCLQHFAMYTQHGHQYNPNNWNDYWTCPICMAGQQQELCLSLVLQRTSQWTRAEATKLCANRKTSYTISLSSLLVPPTLLAHATRLKSLQISLDQPNLHGKEQKEAVFCATFFKHFAMYARNGEQ